MPESLARRLSRLGSSGYIKVGPLLFATAAAGAWSATSEQESDPDDPSLAGERADPPPPERDARPTA